MASFENDTIELKGLDQLVKALKIKVPSIQIGILGNTSRTPTHGAKNAPSNAVIAAVHEFGAPSRNIPPRSFLRVPLSENLNKEMESSGMFDKDKMAEVIQAGDIMPWLKTLAIVAEGVVDDAFETSGNGQWPAWKNPSYTNGGGLLLVDSGQLRQAITSEVKA